MFAHRRFTLSSGFQFLPHRENMAGCSQLDSCCCCANSLFTGGKDGKGHTPSLFLLALRSISSVDQAQRMQLEEKAWRGMQEASFKNVSPRFLAEIWG